MPKGDEQWHYCQETQKRFYAGAELLAAAVLELFSGVHLIRGGASPLGFYYDLAFDESIHQDVIPIIEERMRQFIARDMPIQTHTMIPSNAASLLNHHGHHYPALRAKKSKDPLITLFEFGTFVDLCPAPFLASSGEVGKIKIFHLKARLPLKTKRGEKRVYRLTGCAFATDGELKRFLKLRKQLKESDHREIGERWQLFTLFTQRDQELSERCYCLWRQGGMEIFDKLIDFGKKSYRKAGFENVSHLALAELLCDKKSPFPLRVASFTTSLNRGEIDPDLGLYRAENHWQERAYQYCLKQDLKEELISSLKLIQSISKMLGLKSRVVFVAGGPLKQLVEEALACAQIGVDDHRLGKQTSVLWMIIDRFGRELEGPFLHLEQRGALFKITLSLFGAIERLLALFLEPRGKQLSQKKDFLDKLSTMIGERKQQF